MRKVNTILSEILKIIPKSQFNSLISTYKSDRYIKYFSTYDQFVTLIYAQSKGLNSLREIETGLGLFSSRWYHTGFNGMKRSTFSKAMARIDYRLFEDLFYGLLKQCKLFSPKHKFRFKNPLYSIDSSIIDLCLSVFPWAKFRKRKGAIKLHCMLNHSGCLPEFISITDGKTHDVKAIKDNELLSQKLLPDSIVSFDRAYIDYKFLKKLDDRKVYFVTRLKTNLDYRLVGQHKPRKHGNVMYDDLIKLDSQKGRKEYPNELRLVQYEDPISGNLYKFITNNMKLSAKTIADIYKSRWDIELFFKWIKQNLKIKSFLGTSKNAVMSQIWVAMIYYLILSYIKFQTKFSGSVTELHRIIRETLLERLNLIDILNFNKIQFRKPRDADLQLKIF